ncbi:MAG: biopolymer transporter ExbD [Pirellulaceae bacterium]|jgi:biopolymer transport protein ExbD|nr:biopolymer transporter ExbD [Pirellulaceae bacterium]
MKFSVKKRRASDEGDLTPMIDMTFQLIAFFMILINFSESELSEEIKLPTSALARPPKDILDYKIILNIDEDGAVLMDGLKIANIDLLNPLFSREINQAQREGKSPQQITVILRGHEDTQTGDLQRLMAKCQENDLEVFQLRVKEKR